MGWKSHWREGGTGTCFLQVIRFPLPIFIPRLLHTHHHVPSGAGTIRQTVTDVPNGLSLTPSQEIKKNSPELFIIVP
jgi:hypothetical protein